MLAALILWCIFPFIVLAISIKLDKHFKIKKIYTFFYLFACVLAIFWGSIEGFEIGLIILFGAIFIHLYALLLLWSIKVLFR